MAATRVHDILDKFGAVVFPGAYDAISAKMIERVGFPMGFISGYSVAASMLGEPDMGLLTQTEMIERARQVCRCVSIPIIVDADTGCPRTTCRAPERPRRCPVNGQEQLWVWWNRSRPVRLMPSKAPLPQIRCTRPSWGFRLFHRIPGIPHTKHRGVNL